MDLPLPLHVLRPYSGAPVLYRSTSSAWLPAVPTSVRPARWGVQFLFMEVACTSLCPASARALCNDAVGLPHLQVVSNTSNLFMFSGSNDFPGTSSTLPLVSDSAGVRACSFPAGMRHHANQGHLGHHSSHKHTHTTAHVARPAGPTMPYSAHDAGCRGLSHCSAALAGVQQPQRDHPGLAGPQSCHALLPVGDRPRSLKGQACGRSKVLGRRGRVSSWTSG